MVAYILFLPLSLINFLIVWNKGYFLSTAINIDKFANREFRSSLNKFLKTEHGYKFGRETKLFQAHWVKTNGIIH